MTVATKKAPARKPAEKSSLDYLQHALDDLAHAREQAQMEARGGIDAAVERIQKVRKDLGARARDEAEEHAVPPRARLRRRAPRVRPCGHPRPAHARGPDRDADRDPRSQARAARLIPPAPGAPPREAAGRRAARRGEPQRVCGGGPMAPWPRGLPKLCLRLCRG